MYPTDDGTRTTSEVESIVTLCVKHLDGADQPTRIALAQLVGHILASTQVERVVPPPDPPKRSKKAGEEKDEDEDPAPIAAAVAAEVKLIMTPNEMLSQLSTHFNKAQTSHKTRIGIFSCYTQLLTTLGSVFVERNYALIVGHFMTEIISHAGNSSSRHTVLFVRSLVKIVLRDLIGVRMLSEQAQIMAIQDLSTAYLKRWPALLPGQTAPGPLVLTTALQEVAGLVQQLGNAPPPVQVSWYHIFGSGYVRIVCYDHTGCVVGPCYYIAFSPNSYRSGFCRVDTTEFLLFHPSSTSQVPPQSR